MNTMKKIFRDITLVFCWFTLSPLFYYLSKRWGIGSKPVRSILLLFSPLFGCLYLCLFIIALYAWGEIDRYFMYSNSKDISRITEMNFPEFSTKHYYPENPSFTGDFSNYRVIKFDDIPSDAFYHGLDSLCHLPDSYWSKKGNTYQYDRIWGNGYPAPSGENENADRFLSIELKKGERIATIRYGAW